MQWMLLPFRRYAEFSGRSRRKEFWMFALLNVLFSILIFSVLTAGGLPLAYTPDPTTIATMPGLGPMFWLGVVMASLWALFTLIPGIALNVRRLHDRNLSGWWYLAVIVASMIPVVGILAVVAYLVVMCLNGTPGPNRFGPDPKDPSATPPVVVQS